MTFRYWQLLLPPSPRLFYKQVFSMQPRLVLNNARITGSQHQRSLLQLLEKKNLNCFLFCFENFPISCFPLYFFVNIFFLKIIFILYILIMFLLPQFFPHLPDLPTHQTLFFFSLFKRNKSFLKNLLQKHKNGNQNNQKANKTKPRRSQNKTK